MEDKRYVEEFLGGEAWRKLLSWDKITCFPEFTQIPER
jgi:hypothetical protein